jgi:hypothetical protein
MKSVIGYLILALVVATVVGLSLNTTKPQTASKAPSTGVSSGAQAEATVTTEAKLQDNGPLESGCPQEGHIKSPSSFDKATITFDNQTAGDVKIYWIDFNGNRKFYSTLKAHSTLNQATWIGHVWVVADQMEQCLKLHSANAVEQTLVIN